MPRKPKPILATDDRREALEEIATTIATLTEPATWKASCARPGAVTRFLVEMADAWAVMRRRAGPDGAPWELAVACWELALTDPTRAEIVAWIRVHGSARGVTVDQVRLAFDRRFGRGSRATVARTLFELASGQRDKRGGLRGPLAELMRAAEFIVRSRPES